MKYNDVDVARLIHALQLYHRQHATYYPVNSLAMNMAITTVIEYGKARDHSTEGKINRLFSGRDELEEAVNTLIRMATPLIDTSNEVHDALMYLNGELEGR